MSRLVLAPWRRGLFSLCILVLAIWVLTSYSSAATVKVDVKYSQDPYPIGAVYPLVLQIQIAPPWSIHGTGSGGEGLIPTALEFPASEGIRVKNLRFPLPVKKRFDYTKETVEVFSGVIHVRAELVIDPHAPLERRDIKGRLSYQACSAQSCFPPEQIPVLLSLSLAPKGAVVRTLNEEFFREVPAAGGASVSPVNEKWGSSLWITLLGLFLGGLALNLTPCVYPLIPITVSYFGGLSQSLQGRTFIHGAVYIIGLALTNSLLGVSAALSGGLLGSALQNPWVLILVAAVMVLFALSFFGLWEIRVPSFLNRLASKNFGGHFGTLFMGLTLGIVAAPCLGPFILGLLTYVGQKGDPSLGFLYFFVLSLGMGLPLSVLGFFSGALARLPLSGEWMLWVRKILGWVLVGMAAYEIQPLIRGPHFRGLLFALITTGAGFHLGWIDQSGQLLRGFRRFKRIFGLCLLAASVFVYLGISRGGQGMSWTPYSPPAFAEATKAGRPILLDFYAEWCGPCKAMDRDVFQDPEIVAMSWDFTLLRVDLTHSVPHREEIRRQYDVRGVPTILFLDSEGRERKDLRIEAYMDKKEFVARLKRLQTNP